MSNQMNVDTAKTAVQKVTRAYLRAIDEVAPGVVGDAIKLKAGEYLLQELLEILKVDLLPKDTKVTNNSKSEPILTEGQYNIFDHLPPGSY